MAKLEGRVALVTGGSSGIGRAAALALAAQGAKTVVVGRREKPLQDVVAQITSAGGEAAYFVGDVSTEVSNREMVDFVMQKFGALHVAFLNAGIFFSVRFEDVSEEQLDSCLNTNVKSAAFGLKYIIPSMRESANGKGSIIFNTSCTTTTVTTQLDGGFGICAASKTAVKVMMEYGSVQAAPYVRVNAIAPGFINTGGGMKEETMALLATEMQLIPRMAHPDELAPLLLYLASDDSSFVTGSQFSIDGGWAHRA